MKSKIILISALMAAAIVSCEDLKFGDAMLEKPTGKETNLDTVFSCALYAEQALTKVYQSLPGFNGVQESLTDLTQSTQDHSGLTLSYYTGIINSSTGGWRHGFTGVFPAIRAAWTFVENADRVPDWTQEEKESKKAEALAIIALHYVDLFRNFGGVPWVDHCMTVEEPGVERLTAEETVTKIVELLDRAIPALPWATDAVNDGRMTAAGAMGLKIRLLLFAASPLFNDDAPYMEGEAADKRYVWFGGKDEQRWQKVVDACDEFEAALSANGHYQLVTDPDPREAYRKGYFDRYNGEVLISTRKRKKYRFEKNNPLTQVEPFYTARLGGYCVTRNYVDLFPMKDGTPFDWDNPDHAAHPFFDGETELRDPRLYESVAINGDKWMGRRCESWIGGKERENGSRSLDYFASGFAVRKFILDRISTDGLPYQYPYLRLAEIWLSKAEALNELDRQDEARDYVKKVRDRVGMPNLPAGSKEDFRKALLTERALEFGFETVRLYDMVRWKREDLFRQRLYGLDITKNKDGFLTYTPWELNHRVWQDDWDDKWYLVPFPKPEIDKGYGLIQNPGW